MTQKMYRKISLGNEAKKYMTLHLKHGHQLARLLAEKIIEEKGGIFTIVPNSLKIREEKLKNFNGMIFSEKPREKGSYVVPVREDIHDLFEVMVMEFLQNKADSFFVIEEPFLKASDDSFEEPQISLLVKDDEVYYLLKSDITLQDLHTTLNFGFNFYPGLIGALGSFKTTKRKSGRRERLNTKKLFSMLKNVEKIVVSAYDGEGYLIWERN